MEKWGALKKDWVSFVNNSDINVIALRESGHNIVMRCKACGAIIEKERTYVGRRINKVGSICCPYCKNMPRLLDVKSAEEYAHIRETIIEKFLNGETVKQIVDEVPVHPTTVRNTLKNLRLRKGECLYCGAEYETYNESQKFCSRKCSHDWHRDQNRRPRHMVTELEEGEKRITLPLLIRRDNNICYLCGGQCDINDHTTVNGRFAQGRYYPTIEHVVPLSKGGKHSWANVKLAHNACNAIKGGKYDESKVD